MEWALERGLPTRDVAALSKRLIEAAPPGSAEARVGRLRLAQSSLDRDPWKAALLARELTTSGGSAEEWGTLGLALTNLGHYRAAQNAYHQALAIDPGCPICCHNLGHLLDAAFNRPEEALGYLARAHRALPGDSEIASSYAHALVRAGRPAQAEELLAKALSDPERVSGLLERWARKSPLF
jgi:Flp pilus assembly protein TadD